MLYEKSSTICRTQEERDQLSWLLREYHDVFSKGDMDGGKTTLIELSIPLKPGKRPIRQLPRQLGAEKEAEVRQQVD